MSLKEEVIRYNAEIKSALQTMFDELNQGQQKKILKNEKVKALLERYGVISDE